MNLSRSGASWTLGPKGASVGIGKRGTYFNAGVPGSGISNRSRLDNPAPKPSTPTGSVEMSIKISLEDDGCIRFLDGDGNLLSERLVTIAKRQHSETIREMISKKCDEINSQIEALGQIHLHTPPPTYIPRYFPTAFEEPSPTTPTLKKAGFFASLSRKSKEKVEQHNMELQQAYTNALADWEKRKICFEDAENETQSVIEQKIYSDQQIMEQFLEASLQEIIWPRETLVAIEIENKGAVLYLDVDLPEIEDMPKHTASIPQRGYKLSVKDLSVSQVQSLYLKHIHGIGFRLIGETFAALPTVQEIVISAFSQRSNKTTGHTQNEYLYSARVPRDSWAKINFDNLGSIDVVDSLAQFELRRDLSKTGKLSSITPFASAEATEPNVCNAKG